MLSFLKKYGRNIMYSQNGEEGILLECVDRLSSHFLINRGHAVEIGGSDGRFCSNTAYLLSTQGWSGLFVEGDYNLHLESKKNWEAFGLNVRHQCCYVDERNINAFVDEHCDLLSIDTDGSDYKIFEGLQAQPKIVIVEIDSSIKPPSESFNSDGGASYSVMVRLALDKGYFPLCHTGNLVLIRKDLWRLFPEVGGADPLVEWWFYFNQSWLREDAA